MFYSVERKNDKMRQNITHLESVSIIIVLPYHTGTDQATYKYSVQVTLKRKGTWRMVHTGRVATGLHILSSTEYSVLGKPFIRNRQREKKKEGEYDDFGFGGEKLPFSHSQAALGEQTT